MLETDQQHKLGEKMLFSPDVLLAIQTDDVEACWAAQDGISLCLWAFDSISTPNKPRNSITNLLLQPENTRQAWSMWFRWSYHYGSIRVPLVQRKPSSPMHRTAVPMVDLQQRKILGEYLILPRGTINSDQVLAGRPWVFSLTREL